PGVAIRIIGEVTAERVGTLLEGGCIVIDALNGAGLYRSLWPSFAMLTSVRSVGVMGDGRTYANVVAIRAVTSEDGMTPDWAKLPYDVLGKISSRIVNEVAGVNRVVYDISSKPPATIEWEDGAPRRPPRLLRLLFKPPRHDRVGVARRPIRDAESVFPRLRPRQSLPAA